MGELNDYYVLLNFLIDGAALNEQPLFIYLFIKELAKLGELLHELCKYYIYIYIRHR